VKENITGAKRAEKKFSALLFWRGIAVNRCRIEFVYDAMGNSFPIGVTFDLKTLILVKQQILKEAREEYEAIKDVDRVLCVEHWGNLNRLKDTLDMLVSPETEDLLLSQDRRGAGNGS